MNGQGEKHSTLVSSETNYLVWLDAPTHAVLIEQPATFVIGPFLGRQEVTVQTRWRRKLGQPVCDAIQMHTSLEAGSLDQAVSLATERATRWLAALAFVSRAPVGEARPLLAYDVTPKKEEREFVQYFYDSSWPRPVVAAVEGSTVQNVINAWGRHEGRQHWAVSRAFFWYRRALREPSPADRFMYLWLGLEALEPTLRALLSVRSQTSRCPSCNRLLEDPSTSGIRAHLAAHGEDSEVYAQARKLRVNMFHTIAYDLKVQEESRRLAEPLERALRGAIEAAIDCHLPPVGRLPALAPFLCAVRGRFLGWVRAGRRQVHPHFKLRRLPTQLKPSKLGIPDFEAELVPVGKFKFAIDKWLVPRGTLMAQGERVVSEHVADS